MKAIDRINHRYGRGAVGLGLAGEDAERRNAPRSVTARYTTRRKEIPQSADGQYYLISSLPQRQEVPSLW